MWRLGHFLQQLTREGPSWKGWAWLDMASVAQAVIKPLMTIKSADDVLRNSTVLLACLPKAGIPRCHYLVQV